MKTIPQCSALPPDSIIQVQGCKSRIKLVIHTIRKTNMLCQVESDIKTANDKIYKVQQLGVFMDIITTYLYLQHLCRKWNRTSFSFHLKGIYPCNNKNLHKSYKVEKSNLLLKVTIWQEQLISHTWACITISGSTR